MSQQPISLLICALGGEGGGVLTKWLIDVARLSGYPAQSTSIPGVAQRTGATTYFIEVYPQNLASLNGRQPIFSLSPIPGSVDAVISSELLETARCASNGFPSPERTLIISSSSRSLTVPERTHGSDGRLSSTELTKLIAEVCRCHHVFDMQAIAREHGTAVSAVMLGAIAASDIFPFPKEMYQQVVRESTRGASASLAGFEAAWNVIKNASSPIQTVQQLINEITSSSIHPAISQHFPAVLHPLLQLAYERLVDYQNTAYAQLYLKRMQSVVAAESKVGTEVETEQKHHYAASLEVARYLALWMAYDDVVRVADLKSRALRKNRVLKEVRATESDVVKIYDYFKPGLPELAGYLPRSWAIKLLSWEKNRTARGKEPFALPIQLATHTVTGLLLLRALSAVKQVRRFGYRYAEEQSLIQRWLDAVINACEESGELACAIAQCGRLIKGYGTTNQRGKDNLIYTIDVISQHSFGDVRERIRAINQLHKAASADDTGKAYDKTLQTLGLSARPVKAQPIRWMPKPR